MAANISNPGYVRFSTNSLFLVLFYLFFMAHSNHPAAIRDEFSRDVNMSAAELERWLATAESRSVGQDSGDGESIGHHSGGQLVQILRKPAAELTEADEQHMHRVHSYVSRHSAQRPAGDVEHSRWRYSLMNWGHDPLKK